MSAFINDFRLACALGDDVETIQKALREAPEKASTVSVDILQEPVSLPFYAQKGFAGPDQHLRYYNTMEAQLVSIIEAQELSPLELSHTGLFVGSSSFSVADSEAQYFSAVNSDQPNPVALPIVGYNKTPAKLAAKYGLSHHVYSYATACTSSANALMYAERLIQANEIDHAIVVGAEFYNVTTILGFYGLELLSPEGSILPFDKRRKGLVLGESCASILLSKEQRDAGVESENEGVFRLLGAACKTDNHSVTAANTDGSSIADVINAAFKASNTHAEEITAVKSHGTASLLNDEAEAAGLQAIFTKIPPVFALKPYVGHTLGACGATELALLLIALKNGFIPANKGIAFGDNAEMGVKLAQQCEEARAGKYLLNFFAFGGNNVSLVLESHFEISERDAIA